MDSVTLTVVKSTWPEYCSAVDQGRGKVDSIYGQYQLGKSDDEIVKEQVGGAALDMRHALLTLVAAMKVVDVAIEIYQSLKTEKQSEPTKDDIKSKVASKVQADKDFAAKYNRVKGKVEEAIVAILATMA